MNYEKLLNNAYKKVKKVKSTGRFKIPQVKSERQGNKTIITNFQQIAGNLRRKKEHIEKFLEKELATKGKIKNKRLELIKKIPRRKLQDKIREYTEEYVLCKECGKPDTELIKKPNHIVIHCLACGAKHTMTKI
jgi:translation initiation factor 2 subunit 2